MSRQIDLNAPLSDDDLQYLEARGRRGAILKNQRRFGSGANAVTDPPTDRPTRTDEGAGSTEKADWDAGVDELNVEELRENLARRDLDTTGKKADLVARLKAAGPPEETAD